MFFLCLAVACVGFSLFIQMALNPNFIADPHEINATASQMGYIESARETCGIVAFAFLALLAGLAEPLVAAAALTLVAAGLGSYAFVPKSYLWVLGLSLVWSQGLHVWMPLPNSMCLGLAEKGRAGQRLGQLSAAGAVGSFIGVLLALVLTRLHVPMRPIYFIAGAVSLIGAFSCLGIPRQIRTPGPKLVFRRKYGLYYLLCLLEGWRKQIFLCFSGYLLVRQYHTPLTTMLILWGVAQMAGYFLSPRVGRFIDRVGERRTLVTYYLIMIPIFLGYAFIPGWAPAHPALKALADHRQYMLFALFAADSIFFVFAMALTTYVNRIAPRNEHTATLSMGVAMNHVSAVAMPLVGGLLWMRFGSMYTFLAGAIAGIASIAVSLRIPPRGAEHGGPDNMPQTQLAARALPGQEET